MRRKNLNRKDIVSKSPASHRQNNYDSTNSEERTKESQLIERAKLGDEEAFQDLMELHQSKVYHLLLGILHDNFQAQEVTQETFVKAWKGLRSFKQNSSFWTWLYRIAYRTALDYLRKKRREEWFLQIGESIRESIQHQPEPLEVVLKKDKEKDLHQALGDLSLPQRMAVVLYFFQGLSYREISNVTRRPLGTIRADLHRGKNKLREIISKKWGIKDADARPGA
jgi:RNA polymerase sigma-70 factor (ECF subfamily)